MRKYKHLILFILVTFLWSVFMAMLKFFLWSYLKDINISLEEIMGYLSLGGMIAYLIGGSLAYIFPHKKMSVWILLIMMICLLIGHFLHYIPFRVFVLLMSMMGFVYGIWLIIKSMLLITEIYESQSSETTINGSINIAILA